MKIFSTSLSIPKRGNQANENEDFFFPWNKITEKKLAIFSIADGASEGLLSSKWSMLLTVSYSNFNKINFDLLDFLKFSIDCFPVVESKFIQSREKENKPLQWFEQNLLLKGSFSTFLGIRIYENSTGECNLSTHAIGDSFLFIIRNDEMILSFPSENLNYFGNRPDLISTKCSDVMLIANKMKFLDFKILDGDIIYLMTDAVAHWFLKRTKEGKKPWRFFGLFSDFKSHDFRRYIEKIRELGYIKNDDVTISRLSITCDS
ncbi:MAG: hypothetical protein ACTSQY_06920 [Candidatus Odinarchaeia archaeon]